eukprot:TRINITY_DN8495_c0_g2_i5.p1 TRINITY_DN8495_c0_g2~~TRINITY_DN8495_c0_g2_i5.p1  ORF type:complete len:659 (-),score=157.74 TRINITY_DN8495_c0_g2_i5:352-2328(-)
MAALNEQEAQTIFRLYDADGSGTLAVDELLAMIKVFKKVESEDILDSEAIVQAWDADGDGQVTLQEFTSRLQHFADERPEFLEQIRATTKQLEAGDDIPQLERTATFAALAFDGSMIYRCGTGSEQHKRAAAKWEKAEHKVIKRIATDGDPWEGEFDEVTEERALRHVYHPETKSWSQYETLVKVQDTAFAQGAMRYCYRLKMHRETKDEEQAAEEINWSKCSNFVAKNYIESHLTNEAVREDVVVQMQAKHWAELYNQAGPPKKVEMMYITLIELVDRDQHPLYCVERFIEGDYVKYNSNRGFVRSEEDNQSPTHELLVRQTPQAFSHFSWQESGGELIIVDIQGVGDLYTDPQIHTRTTADDASASANLGQRGMAYFFASHTCTGICSKLGLKPILTCPSDAATLSPKAPVQDPPELGATAEDPQPAKVVRQISEDPQSAKVVRQISARHLRHSTKAGAKKSAKSKSHNLRRLCTEAQRAPTGIISMQMAEDMRVQVAAIPAQPSPAGEIHLELAKMHCYGALADSPDQRDMVAALFHFQLAAQDGHSEAIWNLCKMYQGLPGMLEDLSVPEDPALAAALMATPRVTVRDRMRVRARVRQEPLLEAPSKPCSWPPDLKALPQRTGSSTISKQSSRGAVSLTGATPCTSSRPGWLSS